MLAASFWSLLQPAIDLAAASKEAGGLDMKNHSYIPAAAGLFLGALFIIAADHLFPEQVGLYDCSNYFLPPRNLHDSLLPCRTL